MSKRYHDVGDRRLLKEVTKLAPSDFNVRLTLDDTVGPQEDGGMIAAALCAGGAATHGTIALKFYDQV